MHTYRKISEFTARVKTWCMTQVKPHELAKPQPESKKPESGIPSSKEDAWEKNAPVEEVVPKQPEVVEAKLPAPVKEEAKVA